MTDNKYKPQEIENKWQSKWESDKTYSPDIEKAAKPFYNLMMFPYPSAEGLHVGNMYAFTGADIYGRFKRMQGNDVFEPIGLDGFGIHSENYALKIGKHPKEQAEISQKNFYRQLRSIGNSFDWTRTLETYDPNYYRWTQWLFVTLFKSGLAYRKKAEVNWCPNCKTVLADEQVLQKSKIPGLDKRSGAGKNQKSKSEGEKGEVTVKVCERCDTEVELKELEQWFFKITKYANKLLANLANLDWSEKVKIAQKNWIGRSEGAEIEFKVVTASDSEAVSGIASSRASRNDVLTVFTTRPDTLYGATFMVVAPEHKLVTSLLKGEVKGEKGEVENIKEYVEKAKAKTDIERTAEGKDPSTGSGQGKTGLPDEVLTKSGVFSGLYAINPVNGLKIPVFVADYVLSSYGTGAIMAVPGHDKRDFEFAKKYRLPIVEVVASEAKQSSEEIAVSSIRRAQDDPELIEGSPSAPRNDSLARAYEGSGFLINSDSWNGFHVPEDIGKVIDDLEKRGLGKRKVNFHLRDWLISRQRYWGPPIPMIYCPKCASEGKSWFTSVESKRKSVSSSKYKVSSKNKEILNTKYLIRNTDDVAGWFPVKESELPVILPDVKDWKPMGTGKSPLANHPEFYKTKCPSCKSEAIRETDVSDTFLDSSWYFLRYPSVGYQISNIKKQKDSNKSTSNLPFDTDITRKWLPVDMYIGGAEHSVLHLLYSRFITMALKDLGLLDFEEPFSRFYAHGLIIKDGAKMSKSKGNVVVPDEYIGKYGADALRTYLMFIGPYSDGGDFSDSGIEGIYRFLKRVWRLMESVLSIKNKVSSIENKSSELDLDRIMHRTIKGVTEDISQLKYNTAIAKLMEWYNALNSFYTKYKILNTKYCKSYLLLLAPFAPHLTEELWQELIVTASETKQSEIATSRNSGTRNDKLESIHLSTWPEYDSNLISSEEVIIPVQINGKRRGEIKIDNSKAEDQNVVEERAKALAKKHLEGKEIRKTIYIKGKIINFVV